MIPDGRGRHVDAGTPKRLRSAKKWTQRYRCYRTRSRKGQICHTGRALAALACWPPANQEIGVSWEGRKQCLLFNFSGIMK